MIKRILVGAIFALSFFLPYFSTSAQALEAHNNIKGLFNTTRDLVIKCLECHKEKASEVLKSTHWTWKRPRMVNGEQRMYGKMDSLAGFAIDIASNPSRCLRCHISSAPDTVLFEKSGEAEVDCLVCHDTTGKYSHHNRESRLEQADFEFIARNVGKPSLQNCTTCHFAECGLKDPAPAGKENNSEKRFLTNDVHMNGEGAAFTCQTCHVKGIGHSFSRTMSHGNMANATGDACASCHSQSPHRLETLNNHNSAVSCRTCHIPEYASKKAAIFSWDWFLAGKANPLEQRVSDRGSFLLDNNGFYSATKLKPVYFWDDGSDVVYKRGQRIDQQKLTYLQKPADRSVAAKIAPFRVMYGTQLYDAKYRYLISPLLNPEEKPIFPDSDWNSIAGEGMKAIVLPYSGEYGVAVTAIYRRLNHGVAPADKALDCTDCHGGGNLLDWRALGYSQDPWSGGQVTPTADADHQEKTVNREVKSTDPLQQMQILPFPGS